MEGMGQRRQGWKLDYSVEALFYIIIKQNSIKNM